MTSTIRTKMPSIAVAEYIPVELAIDRVAEEEDDEQQQRQLRQAK